MKRYWLHFTGKQRLSNQHKAIYIFLFANICFNEEDIEARKNYIYGHFSLIILPGYLPFWVSLGFLHPL